MPALLAGDAYIPAAVPTFQRSPEAPLKYRTHTKIGDWWAGRSDRRTVGEQPAAPPDTPWLRRLGHEAGTRLEAERRSTLAVTAVIDDLLAGHRRRVENAQAEIDRLHTDSDTITAETPTGDPTTFAESHESPQQLLSRRRREQQSRLAQLQAREAELRAAIDQTRTDIDTLTAARHSHWTLLLVRSQHLLAHYNRRTATYTRALTRQLTVPPATPTVTGPAWTRQPTDPDQTPRDFTADSDLAATVLPVRN